MEPGSIVLFICLLLPAGLAGAALWLQLRYWRLRKWVETTGRIESARAVARDVRSTRFRTMGNRDSTDFITDESIKTRNFAEIFYSFRVAGTDYCSNRIWLMGEPEGAEVTDLLKRYPQGAVVTLRYNPDNPNDCILERDDAGRFLQLWLAALLLIALTMGGYLAINRGAGWLHQVAASPARVPLVTVLSVMTLVAVLFGWMIGKQARTMRSWPTTSGRIVRSQLATTVQQHRRPGRARDYDVTMYVPRIVYSYEVGGISFQGDDVGWSGSSNTPSLAEKLIRRYPERTAVQVFYDPNDPTQSTLAPPSRVLVWILWSIAAALAFAAFAEGWLLP